MRSPPAIYTDCIISAKVHAHMHNSRGIQYLTMFRQQRLIPTMDVMHRDCVYKLAEEKAEQEETWDSPMPESKGLSFKLSTR